MSNDLVSWLRKRAEHGRNVDETGLAKQLDATADRIEALEADVTALKGELRTANTLLECEIWARQNVEGASRAALETALATEEARAERLREALVRLQDCDWVISLPDRMDAVREIARKAIENDKQ